MSALTSDFGAKAPQPEDIPCSHCKFAAPDFKVGDKVIIEGCKYGYCYKYTDKPLGIMFSGEDCPEFEEGNNG